MQVFLEGPKSALLAGDKGTLSRKAFGRVWAGWGLSQAWYRARLWEKQGFKSLDEFLVRHWALRVAVSLTRKLQEKNYDQFAMLKGALRHTKR